MTRDYSQFLAPTSKGHDQTKTHSQLEALGWQPFFATQIDVDEMAHTPPVRITLVHRNGMQALGDDIEIFLPPTLEATVGDWVLLDQENPGNSRILDRKSLIKRKAPGSDRQVQLIAANIDTTFIVSSCNKDFNVARLERYIALALEAQVSPVIILTKIDLCNDPETYIEKATAISDLVPVVVLDARGDEPKEKLAEWCKPAQTVAFLGSSGVGKSTLVNALSDTLSIATQDIREDDAKGRHTTTRRQLHFVPGGCAVLDTPGMREIQLTDVAAGVEELFADLHDLSVQCKFRDCKHESEPGCAVLAALESGSIDAVRLQRWKKLVAEDLFNSSNLAQRKSKDKRLGKTIKLIKQKNKRDGLKP